MQNGSKKHSTSSKIVEESDERLVSTTLKGHTGSFSEIVVRYERVIFNLMYRTCRSDQEAADLTQEVFLRIYERLELFDGSKRFFPWLYTLAFNKAQDWRRSNFTKLRKLSELQWEVTEHESFHPEKAFLDREETANLYSALDVLPPISREMVLLRYRQEITIKELASIFDVSESAAKMRLSRAMEQLKSVLGGNRNGDDVG